MAGEVELRDFVSTCLREIVGGVSDAQQDEPLGKYVAPEMRGGELPKSNLVSADGLKSATVVEFDVAVTAETTGGRDGKAGVKVWGIGIGGGFQSATRDTIVSRIRFGVPLRMPRPLRMPATKPQEAPVTEGALSESGF